MIFSRLFTTKNKWQAKDSNVRIAAINEELSSAEPEQRGILLSLCQQDESDLVRRAALQKLNDFESYLAASDDNNNASIKKFANAQVNSILTNQHSIRLSSVQKIDFIEKNQRSDLFTHWLGYEQESNLVMALVDKLIEHKNTAHFFAQVFNQKQNQELQLQLLTLDLPELAELNLLAKLLKSSASATVTEYLENKIQGIQIQKDKPIKLQKHMQLVLSKLLALKGVVDFEAYQDKRTTLEQEWHSSVDAIACLDVNQQALLTQKFSTITVQLNKIFSPKEEAYQQAKIAQQLVVAKQQANDSFTIILTSLNQEITTAVFENTQLEQPQYQAKLTSIASDVTDSVLSKKEQAVLIEQIASLTDRLTKLPQIAESVSQATHLISRISQLSLPVTINELADKQITYQQWLSQWKTVEQNAAGVLPESIKSAHQEITRMWSKGLKPLQAEQKKAFNLTKKKLIDIKRLLINGKYKVCFGLFKGVKQSLPLFSQSQQQQLQRDFDEVAVKMAEVSDWEHYIATPRKQQLLSEISTLVKTPLDNPNEQADKVKQYRKLWNSLGHADEALDKDLNEQFNLACEQAFAPCRQFYAEQEQLRAAHVVKRQKVIAQAEQLASNYSTQLANDNTEQVINAIFKRLDGQLTKLQQTWNQTGEVDRKQYQVLQQQFKQTLQPIKEKIKSFHEENTLKKQVLIAQAEQQLTVEDIYQAIEQVKKLQQQWRDIGFAGSKHENQLWQTFRAINDKIFEKRAQLKNAQQHAQSELIAQHQLCLNILKGRVTLESSGAELSAIKTEALQLLVTIVDNKPVNKPLASAIEVFIDSLTAQVKQNAELVERKGWLALFDMLDNLAQCTDSDSGEQAVSYEQILSSALFAQLTTFWQKRVRELVAVSTNSVTNTAIKTASEARQNKTLAIEILAQVDSPAEYSQQRLAVQVALMQEQMQSANQIDLSSQLVEWLQLGKLTAADGSLLTRLKAVYSQ